MTCHEQVSIKNWTSHIRPHGHAHSSIFNNMSAPKVVGSFLHLSSSSVPWLASVHDQVACKACVCGMAAVPALLAGSQEVGTCLQCFPSCCLGVSTSTLQDYTHIYGFLATPWSLRESLSGRNWCFVVIRLLANTCLLLKGCQKGCT